MEALIIFYVAIVAFMAVSMWIIFEKAGQPGWAVLIPIYNLIIFMRIIEKPWWWILLWMIPFAQLIWIIWGWNLMAKKFGKSEGFTVGLILLGFVFIPILAFGSAKYEGAVEGKAGGGAGQAVSTDTVDKVLMAVIIFMFAAAFLRFIYLIVHVSPYGGVTRYIEYFFSFVAAFVPLGLSLVIKNKTAKLVCLILGALYAIFMVYNMFSMMKHMMAY